MRQWAGRHGKASYCIIRDTLVIDLGSVHRVLSSAPCRGGLVKARSILNHQISASPQSGIARASREAQFLAPAASRWGDPARYLGRVASALGVVPPWVALMTAVPMKQLVALSEEADGIWVACFCTVGVTNAVKAGEPAFFVRSVRRCCSAGTINIILVTNACLSVPAMVGAVQVATESKTSVLLDRGVPSRVGHGGATGTGTDAVVIACPLRGCPKVQYSGTHTVIGAMIGRLVGRCVQIGVTRAVRWGRRKHPKG